ncbi:hypothetical protein Gpo141_00009795 [Globisporangium polare]
MANNMVGGKRKRQQSHSEQDKFAHKSGVLLQREAKKVRVFLVRKAVQQLKQSRGQLEAAQREHEELTKKSVTGTGDDDAAKHSEALLKKDKQVKKLQMTVKKLEKELEVFKALDLKAVVARAMNKTGLERKQQEEQQKKLQQQQLEQQKTQSRYGGAAESDDDESDFGGERQLVDESSNDDDDGFDSEEYENSRRASTAAGGDESGSESEDEQEEGDAEGAPDLVEAELMEQSEESAGVQKEESTEKKPSVENSSNDAAADDEQEAKPAETNKAAGDQAKTQQQEEKKKKDADLQTQNALIDRILAHKQMKPLLDAIEKVIEKDEREAEKKLRKQEKKALKRDRNEVLIGGRSSAAPTSLFLGSLSGRGGVIDDDVDMDGFGMSSSYMDGAEDDIAEFLGEKKKKNRMGQNARRQKAIRLEEAAKRKQDREKGIFRPFGPRKDDTVSKYGPSERPKKKKPAAEVQNSKGKSARGKPERGDQRRGERGAPARASAGNGRERERGPPAPVDVSHPSWIAKQKLKEKEKASITAFSGKKITFGDD